MSALTYYHRCIRKITTSFASMFNNIMLIRENEDGTENQRIIVPLEFADKEKYIKRLQNDPELDKKIQITLPRMSYQMNGMRYDSGRKLNTNNKNFSFNQKENLLLSQYNPVPYDFNFSLTIYTRTIEDGNQILEQILPYFTPDYTLKVSLVPEMGIIRNIPIILDQVTSSIDSDGLFNTEVRTIFWTLNFTIKGFIFGGIKDVSSNYIKEVEINYYSDNNVSENAFNVLQYSLSPGNYINGEIIYQGISLDLSVASAEIVQWNEETSDMIIKNIKGDFNIYQPVVGTKSLTMKIPISMSNTYTKSLQTITTLTPYDANINSNWTTTTVINDFQNDANVTNVTISYEPEEF